ncbi:unnamed protein product, partial [Meganyctiphanes norvegica]
MTSEYDFRADSTPVPSQIRRARHCTMVVAHSRGGELACCFSGPPRTSSIMAPIMQLSGHQGDILCGKFHPDGEVLATSGMDRQIYFWNVYGECENIGVLAGHTNAVTDMHFNTDGTALYTASADKMVMCWDTVTGTRVKKLKGDSLLTNCHLSFKKSSGLSCTADQDGFVWSPRNRHLQGLMFSTLAVTSVTFNDTAEQVISGGIDNDMKVWDLRKNGLLYRMRGHNDTVTGISLSPDGSYVLSNAMDNTVRIWDVRPFAPQERCVKIFQGHQHNFENILLRCAWSPDGRRVGAGSSDRFVYVWDTTSRHILYKLPGHNGSVNAVEFHPKEPIVMSISNDKQIFLGEIDAK